MMFKKFFHLLLKNQILRNFEPVVVYDLNRKEKIRLIAKVDTGADRTSIDEKIARRLNLLQKDNIVEIKHVQSGLGKQKRKIINLQYQIKGKTIQTQASVTDRTHLKYPMLIGVKDMKGFWVDPDREKCAHLQHSKADK